MNEKADVNQKSECLFCDNTVNSKEDAFPLWISRLFYRKPRPRQYRATRLTTAEQRRRQWHQALLQIRVSITCSSCNGGWMSNLENFAKPAVRPLILDARRSRVLSLDNQAAIIAWCVKMAFVFEHVAEPTSPRLYTRAEHVAFRNDFSVPTNVHIWIAQYRGRLRAHYTVTPLLVSRDGMHCGEIQSLTIAVGHFAFQVLAVRPHYEGAIDLARLDNPRWSSATSRLWPSADIQIVWPPTEYLTDESLEPFADRWSGTSDWRKIG